MAVEKSAARMREFRRDVIVLRHRRKRWTIALTGGGCGPVPRLNLQALLAPPAS